MTNQVLLFPQPWLGRVASNKNAESFHHSTTAQPLQLKEVMNTGRQEKHQHGKSYYTKLLRHNGDSPGRL